jgi:hypothetical protein
MGALIACAIVVMLALDGLAVVTGHGSVPAPGAVPLAVSRDLAPHPGAAPSTATDMGSLATGAPGTCGGVLRSCPAVSATRPRAAALSGGWLDLNLTTSSPDARMEYAAAYDARDGYVLLFGGYDGSILQDTWTYQKGAWTDISSQQSTTPPARYLSTMTYDAPDKEVVMFGGYDAANSTMYSDTWAFANGQWQSLALKTHPSPRDRMAMAYDAADGYVVLFGGTDASGNPLNDTWKFVNDTWTNISSSVSGSPTGRYRAAMTYDAADKELVLFGGSTVAGSTSGTHDTWAYAGLAWGHLMPSSSPPSRVYSFLAYDPAASAVILYGGATYSGGIGLNDTWQFSNGAWTNVSASAGTPPSWRGYGVLVDDPEGGYLVAFGGSDGGNNYVYSDTWTFGLTALVFPSAKPAATDVGISTTIVVTVLSDATDLSYAYAGLPPGCTSENAASLACRPTQAGTYTILVFVNDTLGDSESANLTIVVNNLPTVTSVQFTPPSVTQGIRTRIGVAASAGTGVRSYAYSGLPPGCSTANTSTLLCTPTKAGTYAVRAVVTDQVGGRGNLSANLTVAPPPTQLGFVSSPPAVDYGQTALLYANVSGGTPPFSYDWRNLPAGCLNANLSPLPCKPQMLGSIQVSVKVSDRFGISVGGTLNLTINPGLSLRSSGISSTAADVGTRLTFYTNVTGGTAPYQYNFTGAPGGCRFPSSSAASCMPRYAGTFSIQSTVTDAAGEQVYSTIFTVVVAAAPTVSSVGVGPKAIDLGQSSRIAVNVSGGTPPYGYAYDGLPPGCAGSVEGSFTCTPTAVGQYPFVVTATDAVGTVVTGTGSLNVSATLGLGALSVSPGTVAPGGTVTFSIAVTSGTGTPPYAYHYTGLPSGCSSSDAPTIHCAPTAAGTFQVQVRVTDAAGAGQVASGTLTVASAGPSESILGLPPAEGFGFVGAIVVIVVALAYIGMKGRPRASSTGRPQPDDRPSASRPPQNGKPVGRRQG